MGNTLTNLDDPRLRILVCGYTRIFPNRWNFSKVSLPHWRFYWNTSSGASIRCDQVTLDLKPAAAILIRPNTVFSTVNAGTCEHLYIHFQMPVVGKHSAPGASRVKMNPPLADICGSLRKTLSASRPSAWRASLEASALVEMALATVDLHDGEPPHIDARILKVLSYMDEHLRPNTSNADLAREARMSAGALNHLFKEQMGHTLQAYLRIKRVEKAARLLQLSDLSIEQIAEETGFCDRYHFSRVFRSQQGIGPAAFRQSHFNPFVSRDAA